MTELFKIEDRGNGYRFATCPEYPGFTAMLKPGEVWFADDHIRALIMLVTLDATASARAEIERQRAALTKVVNWLEKLAIQSDRQERSNRGRFDSLADACASDAKNYRATAADLRKTLTHEQAQDRKP